MRIRLDRDLCQGHGVCCQEAPEVFELDRVEDKARVLRAELPADSADSAELDRVRRAVRSCPTFALTLETDDAA